MEKNLFLFWEAAQISANCWLQTCFIASPPSSPVLFSSSVQLFFSHLFFVFHLSYTPSTSGKRYYGEVGRKSREMLQHLQASDHQTLRIPLRFVSFHYIFFYFMFFASRRDGEINSQQFIFTLLIK